VKKKYSRTELGPNMPRPGLSAQDLAAFLEGLAALHSAPKFGNSELSLALLQLAHSVRNGLIGTASPQRKKYNKTSLISEEKIAELKTLDHNAISNFLLNKSKTKDELITLASARFSMPTSQLKRSRIEEVKAAITSALLHEASIEIISTEADKDGEKRTS
jgi:hypothetical protein